MLRVQAWHHKDGDHLVIVRIPWWTDIYEWLLCRICPCCGLRGKLAEKLLPEKAFDFWWMKWQDLFNVMFHREETLFKVPIESSCVASKAIWNRHDDEDCWLDERCGLRNESN